MNSKFQQTKHVSLILENCDEIIINIKDIENLELNNVYETLQYFDTGSQKIYQTMRVVKDFVLVLKSTANKTHHQFGGILKNQKEKEGSVFDRITQHHDITAIKLFDKKWKEIDYIFVEYEEKQPGVLGSPNVLEKTKTYKNEWNNDEVCEITIKAR